jgi:hypothetical protein
MKFEHADTYNWENAFRGLRHPYESYTKSDSHWGYEKSYVKYIIGPNDMDLAQRMIKAGTPNDKFLRQIFVSIDITAPIYWWKEMDTYKVGTTANSTSTMHKLASRPITLDCFETDDMDLSIPDRAWSMSTEKEYRPEPDYSSPEIVSHTVQSIDEETNEVISEHKFYYSKEDLERLKYLTLESDVYGIINSLERLRLKYLETKDIRYWKELIRWLPESWLQTRTWTADYSVLRNIYHWRKNHKLTEWHQFCDFIVNNLPYGKELIEFDN